MDPYSKQLIFMAEDINRDDKNPPFKIPIQRGLGAKILPQIATEMEELLFVIHGMNEK